MDANELGNWQNVVTILVVGVAGAWSYMRGKKREPASPPSQDTTVAVLAGGALADRSSLIRLAEVLERIARQLEKRAHDDEVEEEAELLRMREKLRELEEKKDG
ncbi:hypothetical protein SAMN05216548_13111 [Faunimonas pinastri]|uniref:Uncharacterized protein n=1 Tax=Faunimonas pinastri TaxID=1855383 RepID=A0A1H9QNQ9_9HYPH|nr:hypothetical protein [Faunimonas pinastri]SER62040.1 hypothetical protein SAMN05216548_13111 [Faunimonas pinastri]